MCHPGLFQAMSAWEAVWPDALRAWRWPFCKAILGPTALERVLQLTEGLGSKLAVSSNRCHALHRTAFLLLRSPVQQCQR